VSNRPLVSDGDPERLGFLTGRLDRLSRRLQQYIDDGHYAGVNMLLLRQGGVAASFAGGFRDLERKLPMERDTVLRVYSMTKIVVSVGALILLEEGKIGLRDPISIYLPEFAEMKVMEGATLEKPELVAANKPITLHHLFTHTSGIIYEAPGEMIDGFYKGAGLATAGTLADLVERLSTLPLRRQPGTVFDYGYSTDILARIIEVVSGKRLDEFLKERILDPLQMSETGFTVPVSERNRLATTYEKKGGFRPIPIPRGEIEDGVRRFPAGGVGLFSTLDDFARFGQMLCNRGELTGKRIIGRKTHDLMVINHLSSLENPYHSFRPGDGFGLGVGVRVDEAMIGTLGSKGLYGWDGIATTRLRIDPVENLVMICCAQHLPFDEYGMFERFQNLVYQAIA
jgi:CubicO group peptidase (beta-lactamase class C family)